MTDSNGNMVMPVAPYYGGYNGGNDGMFGGNWMWFLLIWFAMFGWGGNGFGGGFGGNGGRCCVGSEVQNGFDHQAVMTGISGVQNAVNAVVPAMQNGFAQAEISANTRQMADMNQNFQIQSALQNCCCENRAATADLKYTMAMEAANTRANCDANNQKIMDKLCQLELDGVKQNYEGQIRTLQSQLAGAQSEIAALRGDINRNALGSRILADNAAQTTALEQYLAPVARPAYIVQNPNCCAPNFGYGGCGGYAA